MIQSKIKIKNLQVLDNYNNKIGSANSKLKGLSIYASALLCSKAEIHLKEAIGDKAALYDIKVVPAGFMVSVVLRPKDEKGMLIYTGAKKHSYSSARPMPIADGVFAYRVSHPGFKGKKKKIDAAMRKAARETRQEVRQILRRGYIV